MQNGYLWTLVCVLTFFIDLSTVVYFDKRPASIILPIKLFIKESFQKRKDESSQMWSLIGT